MTPRISAQVRHTPKPSDSLHHTSPILESIYHKPPLCIIISMIDRNRNRDNNLNFLKDVGKDANPKKINEGEERRVEDEGD